jgi:hypothetical protein
VSDTTVTLPRFVIICITLIVVEMPSMQCPVPGKSIHNSKPQTPETYKAPFRVRSLAHAWNG